MKKVLGILVVGLLISGCSTTAGDGSYFDFQKYWIQEGRAVVQICSISRVEKKGEDVCHWSAKETLDEAKQSAFGRCSKRFNDCEVIKIGAKTVLTYEDYKNKEMASMIEKSKSTCKTLGFESGTEKFNDCTLRLYTQEVDNKVALEVAKQKSSGSSNTGSMVIYDPVRDRQNQIDKGMKMLSGGCTLGIDC